MSESSTEQEVGRLALRVEGYFWVAYYAMQGTMDGAILLGSIRLALVPSGSQRKADFMEMMKAAVAYMLDSATGIGTVSWGNPKPGPDHERSGSA